MSESALVRAVRGRIRESATFTDRQVDVEVDEMVPATSGNVYVIVTSGGVEAGPSYGNGRTKDKLYGVDVHIALRSPRKPRDRTRDLWIALTKSFEVYQQAIEDQIDFDYETLDDADTLMIAEGEATGTCDTFVEPLRFARVDRIREAPPEIFAGIGVDVAAYIRTMQFRGARRLETR